MNRLYISVLIIILLIISVFSFQTGDAFFEHKIDKTLIKQSLFSKGNIVRLQHVLSRARRGEDIVIGVIGGSITGGTGAEKVENRWGNLVYRWWKDNFPHSNIKFVNAGIGGTGSNYGAHRIRRDLLRYNPDFVVAEFAVNDQNTKLAAEALEGLTRQVLKGPRSPVLMLLFMTYEAGHNAQEWHSKVGRHYGLPMISYGDAIKYAISEGQLKWNDISADQVHPNSRGNKYCAEFITSFLDSVLADMDDDFTMPGIDSMPEPLISNVFEYTAIYQNTDIKPVKNTGWSEFNGGWKAEKPGSEIEFEVAGTVTSLMYNRNNAEKGIVEVTVDHMPSVKLNGWFFRPWTFMQFDIVASNMTDGRHTLRINLSSDNDKESRGHEFEIQAIMAAGLMPAH